MDRSHFTRVIDLGKDAEPSSRVLEREELAIAHPEKRAAQYSDEREGVLRVGDSTKKRSQGLDFRRLAERTGTTDLDGDIERLERSRIPGDVLLLPGENQEVAESATSRIDFGPDVRRHSFGVVIRNLRPVAGMSQRE